MKVLLLGGTSESRVLADNAPAGVTLVESWAGRTRVDARNADRAAAVARVGGFGGPDGLAAYLRAEGFAAVVDATHPFAATMTRHAALACAATGVPLLRLARPGWGGRPDARAWTWVADHPEAARAAADLAPGRRVLLTVGRQPLPHYRALLDVVARVAEAPADADTATPAPPGWEFVVARGPFDPDAERTLLASRGLGVLVSKDAGGPAAKLDAAAQLGVYVVMVRRPDPPPGLAVVPDAAGALSWLVGLRDRAARQG